MKKDLCNILEKNAKLIFKDDSPFEYLNSIKAHHHIENSEEIVSVSIKFGNGWAVDFDKYVAFVEKSLKDSGLAQNTTVRIAIGPVADFDIHAEMFFLAHFAFYP